MKELFDEWLEKHENVDFTFEAWSDLLKAHDSFPLFIVFMAGYKAAKETLHVRFTHSKEVFRWPPESFIKKLTRKLKNTFGIKPKGSPFVKLEDLNHE